MSSGIKRLGLYFGSGFFLIRNEIERNLIAFLLPLPILAVMGIYLFLTGNSKIMFHSHGIWAVIGGCAFLAMVYGLQCFSGDADRKTLDFVISRPVSPILVVSVKYFTSLFWLLLWLLLFQKVLFINLQKLPLPKGMGLEWIFLIILTLHAMSLFSGLLAKGLERFFAVIVMTGIVAYLSYYFWSVLFELIAANYFWFDIPPYLMSLLTRIFPIYLTIISLAVPLTGTLWLLRNKISLKYFSPGKGVIGIWVITFFLLLTVDNFLAPPLRPNKTAKFGDWSQNAGVVLAGPLDPKFEFKQLRALENIPCRLTLSKLGHKPKIIYQGINLTKPRFSPDGKNLLFSENRVLKILNLQNKEIKIIDQGDFGCWSQEGGEVIYARNIGDNLYKLIMIDLLTNAKQTIIPDPLEISNLLWDSKRNIVYLVGYASEIKVLDLKTKIIKKMVFENEQEPKLFFGLTNPCVVINESGMAALGYLFQDGLKIYSFSHDSEKILLTEEYTNFRLKAEAPVLISTDRQRLIWPRFDGGFGYQATKIYIDKEHELAHKHHHHHEE